MSVPRLGILGVIPAGLPCGGVSGRGAECRLDYCGEYVYVNVLLRVLFRVVEVKHCRLGWRGAGGWSRCCWMS